MLKETKEIIRKLYEIHGNLSVTLSEIHEAGRVRFNDAFLKRPEEKKDALGEQIGRELIGCTAAQLMFVIDEQDNFKEG